MSDGLLDGDLSQTPLSAGVRRTVINKMFGRCFTDDEFHREWHGFEAYFRDWYEEQCQGAAREASVRTHRDILDIITLLEGTNESRISINETLHQKSYSISGNEKSLDISITLAARLWLMVHIGNLEHCWTPGQSVVWEDGRLADSVATKLSPNYNATDKIQLPKAFNAPNLERIAGIRIHWTNNLADHLSMTEDDTKLWLFHHISFLGLHKECGSEIINSDLIAETTRTLALLIPSTDTRCKKWFQLKRRDSFLDPKAGSCGYLNADARQIDNFRYWRDRLVILKQAFDDTEPRTVSQWWYDDRKKVQWYTFWVAALILVLTIVFGLVQSVSGVVQAWASVRSLP